jgi:hypothetical protein
MNKPLGVTGNIAVSGTVDGIDIAARDAVLTSTTTTAGAALPKAGGTMTGDLTIPSKIIHSGDTDTYLRFTDNDDFRIVVGNSTRAAFNTSKIHFNQEGINQDFQVEGEGTGNEGLLYVDAGANKVGIGTASPAAKLSIHEAINTPAIEIKPTTDDNTADTAVLRLWGTKFGTANRYSEIRNVTDGSTANNELAFNTNGTEALRIDTTGNVGIGATSPGDKLTIEGAGAQVLSIYSTDTGSQSSAKTFIKLYGENTAGEKKLQAQIASAPGHNASSAGELHFSTNNSSSAITRRMTIREDGFVGIGHSVPTSQLHVHTDQDNNYAIRIEGSTNNGSGVWTGLGIGGEEANTKSALIFEDAGLSYARGKLHLCVNNETNQNNATPANAKLTVNNDGYIGIGTTAPAKPLHLKVSSGWATMRLEGAGDSGGELEFYATSTKKGSIWFGNDGGFNVRVNGADDTIKINSSRVMAFGGANPLGTNSGTIQAGGDVMATDSFGTLGTHLQIVYTAGTDQELRILRSNGNRVATFTESETFLLGKTASGTTTAGFQASTNDFMCYTNTSTDTGDRLLILNQQNRSSGDLLQFRTQGSNVGIISLNSSGNMVYGGQSDYRLKENVNYTWSATAKLKQLKPCEFEWKSDNYDAVNQGFLAHEVAAVVPQAVVGNKDGVDKDDNPSYQQLDNSALVPLLVKTIQELEARIATLEG